MVHDLSNRHAGVVYQHEVGCQYDDEHRTYLLKEAFQAPEEVGLLAGGELQVGHRALDVGLAVGLYLLTVERLDDGDALDNVQDALRHSLM